MLSKIFTNTEKIEILKGVIVSRIAKKGACKTLILINAGTPRP